MNIYTDFHGLLNGANLKFIAYCVGELLAITEGPSKHEFAIHRSANLLKVIAISKYNMHIIQC